ncbi:hypothetical protein I4U23_017440 [Adineta vaga]|nr:hypothetical protein I4U23_017440 [Adineta vaga]
MARLIDAVVNKLDKSSDVEKYRCPSDPSLDCNEVFLALDVMDNLTVMFSHIYAFHSNDWHDIKNNYEKWYMEKKSVFAPSASSNLTADVLTSNEFEDFFENLSLSSSASTTTTVAIPNQDQRKIMANTFHEIFSDFSELVNKDIKTFSNSGLNVNELKGKIKAHAANLIKEVEKL